MLEPCSGWPRPVHCVQVGVHVCMLSSCAPCPEHQQALCAALRAYVQKRCICLHTWPYCSAVAVSAVKLRSTCATCAKRRRTMRTSGALPPCRFAHVTTARNAFGAASSNFLSGSTSSLKNVRRFLTRLAHEKSEQQSWCCLDASYHLALPCKVGKPRSCHAEDKHEGNA